MDKQATFGFILIGIVLVVWMVLQAPQTPPPHPAGKDSTHTAAAPRDTIRREPVAPAIADSVSRAGDRSRFFSPRESGREKIIVIKTDLYTAELTTRGGMVRKWELQKYLSWDKQPAQLVDFGRGGDFSVLFTSSDGKLVNTRSLIFETDRASWQTLEVRGDESVSVDMVLPAEGGGRIIKRFTFSNSKYDFGADVVFEGMAAVVSNFEYQVVWENGLRYTEQNSVDESGFAMAYAYSGGELAEIDAKNPSEPVKRDLNGATSWVSTHTKYFTVAMLAEEGKADGAYLEGHATVAPNGGLKETYLIALKMPFRGGAKETAKLQVYLGPMQYDAIKGLHRGLEQTMSLGAAWIIRPIAEYVMIPLFEFLRSFIPNYGVVIIIFSIIIKIALQPLTRTSMKSMRKMQALQPLMTEIREKQKDDPEKMNQQIMNLYKEYGVNPAAGCLPLLLQMPILFALYQVFRSSIELRQANFVWWIKDLSIPDTVLNLPFTIPLVGISQISGIVIAMGVTMFVQQKMTPADPRNKAMVWLMPVMFTLMFNGLPAGLNLYYFVFNILSIGQQYLFNKKHKDEPLRKVDPKKAGGGFMAKLTKNLPKMR